MYSEPFCSAHSSAAELSVDSCVWKMRWKMVCLTIERALRPQRRGRSEP